MANCHLTELLEQPRGCLAFNNAVYESPAAPGIWDWVSKKAEDAVCFDMGAFEAGAKIIPHLVRNPYSVCWYECANPSSGWIVGVLVNEMQSTTLWVVFLRDSRSRKWNLVSWAEIHEINNSDVRWKIFPHHDDAQIEIAITDVLNGVCAFLSALNCSNVSRIEHRPPEKLQKARARWGKKPLFSFWTLHLDLNKQSDPGSSVGGAHASPRLHLRRGHARQFAPGKWTWVRDCAVGNKVAGVISKDYALKRIGGSHATR